MGRSKGLLTLVAVLVLAGCSTLLERPAVKQVYLPPPCPTLHHYTRAQMREAAKELQRLPDWAVLRTMMAEYKALRDQVRECKKYQ